MNWKSAIKLAQSERRSLARNGETTSGARNQESAYANATVQSFQRKFDPTDQCKTKMNDYSRRLFNKLIQ
jgi:hypothetical protein